MVRLAVPPPPVICVQSIRRREFKSGLQMLRRLKATGLVDFGAFGLSGVSRSLGGYFVKSHGTGEEEGALKARLSRGAQAISVSVAWGADCLFC
jgi:hypothetical protein